MGGAVSDMDAGTVKSMAGALSTASVKGAKLKDSLGQAADSMKTLSTVGKKLGKVWGAMISNSEALKKQTDRIKKRFGELAGVIGDRLAPLFEKIADLVSDGVSAFKNLPGPVKDVVAALFAVVSGVVMLGSVVAAAQATIMALVSTFGTLLAPILLIAGAIGLLWVAWKNKLFGMREIVNNLVKTVKKLIADFVAFVKPRVMAFLGKLSSLWRTHFSEILSETKQTINTLMPVFQAAMAYLQTVAKVAWNIITTVFLQRLDAILSFVRAAMAVLRGDFGEAFQIIAGFFQRTVDRFAGLAGALFAILGDILTVFVGFAMSLSALIAKLNARVTNRFRLMMEVAIAKVKTGLNQMVGFWESAANSIVSVVNDVGDTIQQKFNTIAQELNKFLPESMEIGTVEFGGFENISIDKPFEVRSRTEIEAAAERRLQDRLDGIDRAKREQMEAISKAIDNFFGKSGPQSGGSGGSDGSGGSGGSTGGFGTMFGRSGSSRGPGSPFSNTGGSGSSSGSDGPLSGLGDSSSGAGSSLPGMGSSSSRRCCCPSEKRSLKTGTGSLPGVKESSTGPSSPSTDVVDPSNVVGGPFSAPRPNAGSDSSSGPSPGAVEPPAPPILSDSSGSTEVNIEQLQVSSDAPAPNTRKDSRNLSEDIATEFGSQLHDVM